MDYEKARFDRRAAEWANDDRVVPLACEVSFNLRIPHHHSMGRWVAEAAIKTLCLVRGWELSDRVERHGPKAKHVHLIFFAAGRVEAARRGVKDIVKQLEAVEEWNKAEIGLDTWIQPVLY